MSFLLLGARGTGKTWLLRHLFRDEAALWINLLEHRDFLKYRARPGLLREEIVAILRGGRISGDSVWVIIDEVQRVPELLNEVHAMVEDTEIQGEGRPRCTASHEVAKASYTSTEERSGYAGFTTVSDSGGSADYKRVSDRPCR